MSLRSCRRRLEAAQEMKSIAQWLAEKSFLYRQCCGLCALHPNGSHRSWSEWILPFFPDRSRILNYVIAELQTKARGSRKSLRCVWNMLRRR
jgi:hypothetical protein